MKFTESSIEDVYLIEPELMQDERGFFARTFCKDEFTERGLCSEFPQCSVSFNTKKGTLRGMHFQKEPHAETKIIHCTSGSVYDVALDLRPKSKTFKKWVGYTLSASNHHMLYIPKGCAHGFITLEENTELSYHISCPYVSESAMGVRFDDLAFAIKWPIQPSIISQRDKTFPLLGQLVV